MDIKRTALSGAIAIALLGGAVGLGASGTGSSTSSTYQSVSDLRTDVSQPARVTSEDAKWDLIAKDVSQSVVSVRVRNDYGSGMGSGVIIDSEGHILTNHHVVNPSRNPATRITVIFHDSSVYLAKIVHSDPVSDLAVLKLDKMPAGLKTITFGDSAALSTGDQVLALGSPLGLQGTATNGIISAVNRPVSGNNDEESRGSNTIAVLQTNAAINPGNSGGPLVNSEGQLVGINSSIATTGNSSGNIGIGFAIPSNTAKKIIEYLLKSEDFPYGKLSIMVSESTGLEGSTTVLGAKIMNLIADGGADKAGLKPNDVIVGINGNRIASDFDLIGMVRSHASGETVEISYLRDGKLETVKVVLS